MDITTLLDDLNSPQDHVRQAAERELRAREPELVPSLVAFLRGWGIEEGSASGSLVAFFVFVALFDIVFLLSILALTYLWIGLLIFGLILVFSRYIPEVEQKIKRLQTQQVKTKRQQIRVAEAQREAARRALEGLEDVRSLLPLVRTLSEEWAGTDQAEIPKPVGDALARLLARLDADGVVDDLDGKPCLIGGDDDYQSVLLSLLSSGHSLQHPDLVIEILRLAERTRDLKALPSVRRLAAMRPYRTNSHRVQEEAQRLLPILEALADHREAARTLLRPSSEPDEAAKILLRPVQGAPEADPNVLLRPSAPE